MTTALHIRNGSGSWAHVVRNWLYVDVDLDTDARAAATSHAAQVERQFSERTRELESTIAQLLDRQKQLEAEVNHDNLTGLANRKLLNDRFLCAMKRARRSGESFALLMIDLNGFKAVNDNHGHAAGDKVLVTVAQRLETTLRTCDTAARLGGDEFVVLVESIHAAQEVVQIARKLAQALAQDICLQSGARVTVGASMGMALYPDDGLDLSSMLCVADQAMYECKASGFMSL